MVKTATPIYLFIGDDEYRKDKAIRDLASSLLGGESKDLDYKVFYAGEAEPGEVLDNLKTIPFLSAKRLVVIRNLEKSSADLISSLNSYAEDPLKSTCLILEASGVSTHKDLGGLVKRASVCRFQAMTGSEVAGWIREAFRACDKKIDPEGLNLLRELQGHNLPALAQEIEKLAAFAGDAAEVRLSDVEELVGKSLVSSTFDLADALGSKMTERALTICRELAASGKREYEIIGLLSWHFKRLYRAKTLQSRGRSDNSIAIDLKMSERYRRAFFSQVSGLSIDQIRSGIRTLLEADLDIKRTRLDYAHSGLVLEFAIIKLSQIFSCGGSAPLTLPVGRASS